MSDTPKTQDMEKTVDTQSTENTTSTSNEGGEKKSAPRGRGRNDRKG